MFFVVFFFLSLVFGQFAQSDQTNYSIKITHLLFLLRNFKGVFGQFTSFLFSFKRLNLLTSIQAAIFTLQLMPTTKNIFS